MHAVPRQRRWKAKGWDAYETGAGVLRRTNKGPGGGPGGGLGGHGTGGGGGWGRAGHQAPRLAVSRVAARDPVRGKSGSLV